MRDSRPISWHFLATYRAGIADPLLSRPISWHSLAAYRAGFADSLLFRPISWHSFATYRAGFTDSLLSALSRTKTTAIIGRESRHAQFPPYL